MKNNTFSPRPEKKIMGRDFSRQQSRGCPAAHREGITEQIFTLQPVVDAVLEWVDISCGGPWRAHTGLGLS